LLLYLLKLDKKELDDYLNDKNNDKLRKPAHNLLVKDKRHVEEKISLLNNLKEILTESEQSSVGVYCEDAGWMLNKKGKKELIL
jgi:hypothetical protein